MDERKFVKFITFGSITTVIYMITSFALIELVGLEITQSHLISYLMCSFISYTFNRSLVFKKRITLSNILKFSMLSMIFLIITGFTSQIIVEYNHSPLLSIIIIPCLYSTISYLAMKFLVFSDK